jgi:hypothetical protein
MWPVTDGDDQMANGLLSGGQSREKRERRERERKRERERPPVFRHQMLDSNYLMKQR